MIVSHIKSLFYLKGILRTSPISSSYVLLQQSSSIFTHKYCTGTVKKESFSVKYLIENCGFSPETALLVSKRVSFESSEKPDSVLELFRNCGFSDSQLRGIIGKVPSLLRSNPIKTIWPKLEFLLSKGASCSQLVEIVTRSPRYLKRSLADHIIPCYDFVKRFLPHDKRIITAINRCNGIICDSNMVSNVKLLLDNGVPESGIASLLHTWPRLLNLTKDQFSVAVEEVKKLGLDPSKSAFIPALYAKKTLNKGVWDRKVDVYKKWGWSDEAIDRAFSQHPYCMMKAEHKIEAVMGFFVNHLGWNSAVIAKNPVIISFSLEKRIIPRAFVLQHLQSRGLIKDTKVLRAFHIPEKTFLEKFVNSFKDDAPQLLKLYEEKMNLSS
ncbi:hypothetical protein L6164_035433 [Bauhinia variegata]|uniref:Uncharacterized protein n=1 Tax=Bauhinia variegata TaxID=167791 RepID=A0ACB9KE12_BAUVA|nr:hypothetical protein L6164_035433 [Bauhinia variegata]